MRLDHPLRSLPFRLVATAIALAACAAVVTSGEARSPAPKRKAASRAAGSTAAAPAPRMPGMVAVIDPVTGGIVRATELCNGNGACRKTQGGTMCPSYRATLDEKDTTRGRANALRLALTGGAHREGEAPAEPGACGSAGASPSMSRARAARREPRPP